jgi:hypothetical protein
MASLDSRESKATTYGTFDRALLKAFVRREVDVSYIAAMTQTDV